MPDDDSCLDGRSVIKIAVKEIVSAINFEGQVVISKPASPGIAYQRKADSI